MNIKYKFHFYVSRGHTTTGIGVEITAPDEEKARKKLDKILLPKFEATLQRVIEE